MMTPYDHPSFSHRAISIRAQHAEFPSATPEELEELSLLEDELELDCDAFDDFARNVPIEAMEYLRDFIATSAFYVEELETTLCERSDDFWETREHAYRIVTGLLLSAYEASVED